jgi:hypothetical protein
MNHCVHPGYMEGGVKFKKSSIQEKKRKDN